VNHPAGSAQLACFITLSTFEGHHRTVGFGLLGSLLHRESGCRVTCKAPEVVAASGSRWAMICQVEGAIVPAWPLCGLRQLSGARNGTDVCTQCWQALSDPTALNIGIQIRTGDKTFTDGNDRATMAFFAAFFDCAQQIEGARRRSADQPVR